MTDAQSQPIMEDDYAYRFEYADKSAFHVYADGTAFIVINDRQGNEIRREQKFGKIDNRIPSFIGRSAKPRQDAIDALTARVSELERERQAFRQAIDGRLAGYEEMAARDNLTAFGRHAQSIVKSIKADLDRAALPPIPDEVSHD